MKLKVLLFAVIIAFASCSQQPNTIVESYLYIQNENRDKQDWQIIWEDHFDNNTLDTSKWSLIPPKGTDWANTLTDDPRTYEFKNGNLHLKGIVNPDTTSDTRKFLTAGIYSKGKFAYQYGKIEIRAKLESAHGAWPAIWMLAEKNKYGKYPKNGEIDIMEHLNYDDIIYQTTHSYYTLELKQKTNPQYYGTTKINIQEFNTFGLEWHADKLIFTLNGKETFEYPKVDSVDSSQWPYDQPFYIMIDQQLGGSWVGEINPAHLPVDMIIDYVKVYQ